MAILNNTTSITDILINANAVTSGYLIWSYVVLIWCSIFFFASPYGRSKAALTSSFITGIILLVLNILELVPYWLLLVDLGLFAISFIAMMFSKRRM